jgi:hypothetical protein
MFRLTSVLNKLASLSGKLKGSKRPSRPKSIQLHLEALETRVVPASVSFQAGGAIIPNVQVETVYYGQAWTNANDPNNPQLKQETSDLDKFFTDITGSAYVAGLRQYTGFRYNGNSWYLPPTPAAPGAGQFLFHDLANGGALNTAGNVDEATITNTLKQEIANGKLSAPDANKLYVVVLAPGLKSQFDLSGPNGTSPPNGGGHHAAFLMNGVFANYVVVDHPLIGTTPGAFLAAGVTKQETSFQALTETASHELVEAITNPAGFDKVDPGAPNHAAWTGPDKLNPNGGAEIGDIPQDDRPVGGGVMGMVDGYMVQQYWSQKDRANVIPGGVVYQDLTQVPAGLSSPHFTLTSLTQGARTSVQLQITLGTVTTSTFGQSTFAGTWTSANGVTENIAGSFVVKGQTVLVTVYSIRTGQSLFAGALSTPNGNWKDGVELTGTANGVSYFGVQDGSQETSLSGYGGWGNGPTLPIPKHHPLLMIY